MKLSFIDQNTISPAKGSNEQQTSLLARVELKKKRAHLDRLGDGRILNRNWNYFLGPEPVCSFLDALASLKTMFKIK